MQKLLSIFIYLLMLIFIESAAEVTGVPASAPAEISAEPKYVALTFDDGPRRDTTARLLDGLRQRGPARHFFWWGSGWRVMRTLFYGCRERGTKSEIIPTAISGWMAATRPGSWPTSRRLSGPSAAF